MSGFKLRTFGGKAPQIYPRLLPDDMAQVATYTRLDSGRLEAWKTNDTVSVTITNTATISANTKTLFRYNSSVWIAHDDELDIIRSPLAEDSHDRIYLTGFGGSSGYPRVTTATIVGSDTYYRLGLPKPGALDGVTLSPATSANADTEVPQARSYVFTYVSFYGEEGEPSTALTAQIVSVHSDQSVVLDFPTNPSGGLNFATGALKRVYRTDSSGTYRFVADVPIASGTYEDSVSDANLGEALLSSTWEAAPDETSADHPDGPLLGLIPVPNGFLAGFSGQTVAFSESFQPHAWPDQYKFSVMADVVALAPLGSGVLVLTKEKPAVIQGADPAAMSMTEIDSTQSCVSKRSVVDMGQYVLYASPDGIAMADESGINVITEGLLSRDQWQELVPSTIVAFSWEGHYIGFYNDGSESKGFIFDPRGGKNSYVKLDFHATAGYNDLENDTLYLVIGTDIVKFAEGSTNQTFTWRSKKFYGSRPGNPSVARVECDAYTPNPTFKLYADGDLKHTQTLTSSNLFRLPAGYKANEFEVEVSGSVPINEICVYESPEEIDG